LRPGSREGIGGVKPDTTAPGLAMKKWAAGVVGVLAGGGVVSEKTADEGEKHKKDGGNQKDQC